MALATPLCSVQAGRAEDTIDRFKRLYGNVRDYKDFKLITLNGQGYILAFWYEDNDPLQLEVTILAYSDEELKLPVYKAFTGYVSEAVINVVQCNLTSADRRDLVFLSRSGQIELVRVLRQKGRNLELVFENGGSDVTLPVGRREIWIKSRTGKDLVIYKWDQTSGKFVAHETLPIDF